METCTCGGEIPRFTPGGRLAVDGLPVTCCRCGAVFINGKPVDLPAHVKERAFDVMKEAHLYGRRLAEEISKDPLARVEAYLENVYRSGYIEGFFRALASTIHSKEGRLVRLREIWGQAQPITKDGRMTIEMTTATYEAFTRLLNLGKI